MTAEYLQRWAKFADLAAAAQARINRLQEAIAWSRENGGLHPGQRICIHQEIARQLNDIDTYDVGEYPDDGYSIPPGVEEKVQHITRVIKNTGWEKPEIIKY